MCAFNDVLTAWFGVCRLSKAAGHFPQTLREAPVFFRPTYKFDHNADVYDSSKKQRIPSWTDRILFKAAGTRCLAYNSIMDLRSSDHRPVYATFAMNVELEVANMTTAHDTSSSNFTSESQVCIIM